MGDDVSPYIPIERWDLLGDDFPPLGPGNREAVVLSLDSAVSSDCFALTIVSRHPDRRSEAAIRMAFVWRPQDFPDKRIDFAIPKALVRLLCLGGCMYRHPRTAPNPECAECREKRWTVAPLNVVQITYDPHQLEDFSQELRHEGLGWFSQFDQGQERLIGDAQLYRMAMAGTVHWAKPVQTGVDADGNPTFDDLGMAALRDHIRNCKAKLQPDQESTMRIVKRTAAGKVDLAVSAAMAVKRLMELNLG